jgi:hypothetical protein
MAAISEVAKRRHETLTRALDALGVEGVQIPSTKANPIETGAFYVEILANLAKRMVSLECGRISHEASIDALAEAVTVFAEQASRKAAEATRGPRRVTLKVTPRALPVQGRR